MNRIDSAYKRRRAIKDSLDHSTRTRIYSESRGEYRRNRLV